MPRCYHILILSVISALTSLLLTRLLFAHIFRTSPTTMPGQTVIVVGSGLAGLSAATTLTSAAVPVLLLERSPKPGGNSLKASSGINGAPTPHQPPSDPDSADAFYADTLRSAGAGTTTARERQISTLTSASADAVAWLVERGVDLARVVRLGGHSHARTHRGAAGPPPGAAIVGKLLEELKKRELFTLQTESEVVKVLRGENGRVEGVEYVHNGSTRTARGPVIFAAGGFAGDARGMLATYRPDLAGIPSTNENRPGMQGLLVDVGARLVDMDKVQVHPTSFVDPKDPMAMVKFLAAELLRGEGGVLLAGGKRFVNELGTRKEVTAKIMEVAPRLDAAEGKDTRQWDVDILLDEGAYEAAKSHVGFYLFKGLMRKAAVGELGETVKRTLAQYADVVHGKQEDEHGRRSFGNWRLKEVDDGAVVYIGKVTPAVHFTMGGAEINEKAEVLDTGGKVIRGLWAAGEISGGLHGENRLAGNSLLECVVFGRIAGSEAAKYFAEQ